MNGQLAAAMLVAGCVLSSVGTGRADTRALPVSRAPFEMTGKARLEPLLLSWNYRSWAFAPADELLTWAALVAYLLNGAFGSGQDAWAGTLTHGLAKYTGGAYKVILVAVRIGIAVCLLSCWRRLRGKVK